VYQKIFIYFQNNLGSKYPQVKVAKQQWRNDGVTAASDRRVPWANNVILNLRGPRPEKVMGAHDATIMPLPSDGKWLRNFDRVHNVDSVLYVNHRKFISEEIIETGRTIHIFRRERDMPACLMLQILALDLVNIDSALIERVRSKLADKIVVPPSPSPVDSYQLNVKSAISLYP